MTHSNPILPPLRDLLSKKDGKFLDTTLPRQNNMSIFCSSAREFLNSKEIIHFTLGLDLAKHHRLTLSWGYKLKNVLKTKLKREIIAAHEAR